MSKQNETSENKQAGNSSLGIVSNRAIEFGKWLQESTPFKPTSNKNEWTALHMGNGWQLKTTEELYSDFCKEHGG